MDTTAHFENIPQEIAKRLNAATQEIVVAVAWFTDRDLFDVLCKQAGRGVRVRLAVLDDRINVGPGRLNFQRLRDIGGEVFLIPAGSDRAPTLDHNFCIIDQATVITGSYPWIQPAQDTPDGLILVITDNTPKGSGSDNDLSRAIAADYLDAFQTLLRDHGLGFQGIDPAEVRRRLEIVRNLLLLEDWDTLATQLDKLQTGDDDADDSEGRVHRRVHGAGGQTGEGWKARGHGGQGTGSGRADAVQLGQGIRRWHAQRRRCAEGGARSDGTIAPAQRSGAAEAGERHPAKSGGVIREGGAVKDAWINAHRPSGSR